jgi:hypothetical protein
MQDSMCSWALGLQGITIEQKVVLAYLGNQCDELMSLTCSPPLSVLASKSGLTCRQTYRALLALEKLGCIERRQGGRSATGVYRLRIADCPLPSSPPWSPDAWTPVEAQS